MLVYLIILQITHISVVLPAEEIYKNEEKRMPEKPQSHPLEERSSLTDRELNQRYDKDIERSSSIFIYEGTKWCGKGDIANDYNDLGELKETDSCCRKHDHCPDFIPGYGEKYGLINGHVYTMSRCDCDEEFYSCLKRVNSNASNDIGWTFFNKIEVKCIFHDYPIKSCKLYQSTIYKGHERCIEYEVDETKQKIWQIFENKAY
uniref:Phospholipase A2 n=1 Tax=Isometrus maculatus TaxID=497827 RepID=A0A0U1TZ64_ISOMC|nr:hypothetical protein [Isometrus maculatus]